MTQIASGEKGGRVDGAWQRQAIPKMMLRAR